MNTTPQALVEHALVTSTADDCIVIVSDSTSANLRWANNTLTTNGVMHRISVTVISFIKAADGIRTGSVTGSASSAAQVASLVAGRRRRGPGRLPRRGRRRPGHQGRRRPTGTSRLLPPTSTSTTSSPPPWARRSVEPRTGSGCSTASSTTS